MACSTTTLSPSATPSARWRDPALSILSATDDRLLVFSRGTSQRVVAVYNLSGTTVSGAQVDLSAGQPIGPQRDLLSGTDQQAIDPKNRAHYPLPSLPGRSA